MRENKIHWKNPVGSKTVKPHALIMQASQTMVLENIVQSLTRKRNHEEGCKDFQYFSNLSVFLDRKV